jgi:glycosyltransferase involved in cell wall biosynthesis
MSSQYACDVIVTCHNYENYLEHCLRSLKTQVRKPREILVVDDASDNPAAVAEVCARFSVKCHRVAFRNACRARDFGLLLASSSHVLFLDADNFLFPRFLDTLSADLEGNDAIAYSPAIEVDADGLAVTNYSGVCRYDAHKFLRGNQIDTCALVRRTAVLEAGAWSWNGAVQRLGDWNLMMRIINLGWNVRYVPEPLWAYRVHGGQMSSRLRAPHSELAVVYARAAEFAVVTPFCGRRWCLDRVLRNYERLGIAPGQLHGVFIDNSADDDFHRLLAERLHAVCREWRSVSIVRMSSHVAEQVSNEDLANTAAHRVQHAQRFGEHMARIYAVEARRVLPRQCAFVLTLEDDVEVSAADLIPTLLEGMDASTQAVSGVVRSRFVRKGGAAAPIAHVVRSEHPYVVEPVSQAGSIQVVGATGMHCTLWRREAWDRHMPLYCTVNDAADTVPWHDHAFCARIRQAGPGHDIKLHWRVATRHLHRDGNHVIEV